MTPKQIERLQQKIKDIKSALAAEKKKFGGYFDGRGLRYMPLRLFLQMDDFAGAARYLKWFEISFPTDTCYPDFSLESAIVQFASKGIVDLKQKLFVLFCMEPEVFNLYLQEPVISQENLSGLNNVFQIDSEYRYPKLQVRFPEFYKWLAKFASSEEFKSRCLRFVEIQQSLQNSKNLRSSDKQLYAEAERLKNLPFGDKN